MISHSCIESMNSDKYDRVFLVEESDGLGIGYNLVCRYCGETVKLITENQALDLVETGEAKLGHDVEFEIEIGSQL